MMTSSEHHCVLRFGDGLPGSVLGLDVQEKLLDGEFLEPALDLTLLTFRERTDKLGDAQAARDDEEVVLKLNSHS